MPSLPEDPAQCSATALNTEHTVAVWSRSPDTPQQYGTGIVSKHDVRMRQYGTGIVVYNSMGIGTNFSMARFRNWY